jgi:segregation and condensation protein B
MKPNSIQKPRKLSTNKLMNLTESILFASGRPMAVTDLAEVLKADPVAVEEALDILAETYRKRGIRLQRSSGSVQMVTAPEAAPYIERLLGSNGHQRLSGASLETLAVIAYKQPITRADIEAVRGVNCERAIKALKARDLITEVGRSNGPGRPYLLGTTFKFLQYFGLERPEDLPAPQRIS